MEPRLSYHDVTVIVDDVHYRVFDSSYGLELRCSRATGWELWNTHEGASTLIGGEYSGCKFSIKANDVVVCG